MKWLIALALCLGSPAFAQDVRSTVPNPVPTTAGGTNCTSASITCFNNITGFTAAGTTGTTSTNVVFSTSPTLVTPALGTPTALVGTNITGTAASLTAGNVTTNANLTGPITSSGNATSIASGNTYPTPTITGVTTMPVNSMLTSGNGTFQFQNSGSSTNEFVMQHDGTNGFFRPQAGNLDLGAGGVGSRLTISGSTGAVSASVSIGSPAHIGSGSAPTASGTCAINTQLGGNTIGSFKANGVCTAGTVILTFATTATNGWACEAQDLTTRADAVQQTGYTTTTATFTGTMVSADLVTFNCSGF